MAKRKHRKAIIQQGRKYIIYIDQDYLNARACEDNNRTSQHIREIMEELHNAISGFLCSKDATAMTFPKFTGHDGKEHRSVEIVPIGSPILNLAQKKKHR